MTMSKMFNNFHIKTTTMTRRTLGLSPKSLLVKYRTSDMVLFVIIIVVYALTYNMNPFQRQFSLSDLSIQHPFAKRERVTNNELFLYSTIVPLITIITMGLPFTTPPKYRIYNTLIGVIGLLLSVGITTIVTNILKNYIGRLRPDFIARCVPKEGTPVDILVFAKDVCTTTDIANLLDGFRTTPSGHSSMSFAGLFYLTLWISGQLYASDFIVGSWRAVLAWVPTLGAALIAISRTEDYRHHFIDVTLGSLLGLLIALWSYFRLFPKLTHDQCHYSLNVLQDMDEKENEMQQRVAADAISTDDRSTLDERTYSALQSV